MVQVGAVFLRVSLRLMSVIAATVRWASLWVGAAKARVGEGLVLEDVETGGVQPT